MDYIAEGNKFNLRNLINLTEFVIEKVDQELRAEDKHHTTFGNDEQPKVANYEKNKVPKAMDEDDIYHSDFVKLANMMKDKINCMLLKDSPDEIPVYSILIGSYKVMVYALDLVYTHVYICL
ncbi:hypothetical protein G6F37_012356 [Rhizopus arrhizus]|nr:hypothetical protein G6F38_012377 [Rhizopus arrhizus]KAG1144061.1 hypothetical protein G6F37_012356 [Rhizopus arrhizus]